MGHINISRKFVTEDGFALGHWIVTQRYYYSKGMLSIDRRIILEQLPGWAWDSNDIITWNEGFKELQRFVERENNAAVPEFYTTDTGFRLGNWVGSQQSAYKNGNLSKELQKALEQLTGWAWDSHEFKWNEEFKKLQEFVEREGNSAVHSEYVTENGFELGLWVFLQRASYENGKLTAERQKALEQLTGWTWDNEISWKKGFHELQIFVGREGHSFVPQLYKTRDGYPLGIWVDFQRTAHEIGILSQNRKENLKKLIGLQ